MRAKWALALLLGGVVMAGAIYSSLTWLAGEPASDHAFFKQGAHRPLVMAHRGGAGLWPENTVHAFERARNLGVDVIETDVRLTADGVLVVIHDATVERTTGAAGSVGEVTLAELKKLDAAYNWSPDGGEGFPLRGQGITVPTLEEVFAAFPEMRFNIEPKQDIPSLAKPLCRAIREHGMASRVLVGSFCQTVLDEFRRECPEVATSASPAEVAKFLATHRAGLGGAYSPAVQALQVPESAGGLQLLTRSFIEAAHGRNLQVHVWTINGAADMRRLLADGVDGIVTDYPDRLMALLSRTPAR